MLLLAIAASSACGHDDPACTDGRASAGCLPQEACGDGFLDTDGGEECDDGGRQGHDGCSSTCGIEELIWRAQSLAAPDPRESAAIVYDPIRRVLVMNGGVGNNQDFNDTWEWNGLAWRNVTPQGLNPTPRGFHALAYDPERHRVVLFGGLGSAGPLNDTLEWDGAVWRRMHPPISPPGRLGHSLAWDPSLHRVVLKGGYPDTWTWDGATWTEIKTVHDIPEGPRGFLLYDTAQGHLVHVRMEETGISTFVLAGGTDWVPFVTTGGPTGVDTGTAVFDPVKGIIIAHTIYLGTHSVWELKHSTWEQATIAGNPDVLRGAAPAFDIERNRYIEWGGRSSAASSNDLWELDGTTWTRHLPITSPEERRLPAMAYDPARAKVVLFGGETASGVVDETWEWNGSKWTQVFVKGPPARLGHAMAYDATTHAVLLFGGRDGTNGTTLFSDTWTFDGAQWTLRTPTASPSARQAMTMAFDSARNRIVLFGGKAATETLDDTWEWTGTTWEFRPVSSAPRNVSTVGMAYDSDRARTVLYPSTGSDTWQWDGTTWTRFVPAISPGSRNPVLVYNRARHRTLTVGSTGGRTNALPWEWDGTTWTQPIFASSLPLRNVGAAAYDEARGEVVAFGVGLDIVDDDNTWVASYAGSEEEVCTSGHDVDHDGRIGCADEDCAMACARCGNRVCDDVENDRLCPADCPASAPVCGDAYCAPAELASGLCPADCPRAR